MKNRVYLLLTFCLLFVLSCSSNEVKLVEITSEKIPDVKKVPPVEAMIVEVEIVKGEQKYIYIKIGSDNEWFKEGLFGYIYNDVGMKDKIGKFKVIEVYNKRAKGEIIELGYTIEAGARVFIEVDPRFLIKEKE
jgi:hypothetical protein